MARHYRRSYRKSTQKRRRSSTKKRSSYKRRRSSTQKRRSSTRKYSGFIDYATGKHKSGVNRAFQYRHSTPHTGCTVHRSMSACGADPNCNWLTGRGCVRRSGVASGLAYSGPMGPPTGGRRRSKRKSTGRKRKSSGRKRRSSSRRRKSSGRKRKSSKKSRKSRKSRH